MPKSADFRLLDFRLRRACLRRKRHFLRRDLGAYARLNKAIDDDPIVGAKTRFDHSQAVNHIPELDVSLNRRVVRGENKDVFASLLGADGSIGKQERLIWGR